MISITVELLAGVLRASPGEAGMAGSTDTGLVEWPPSPARLFQALVSSGGTRDRNRVESDDGELRLLEDARPPVIAADADDQVQLSQLRERYVVVDDRDTGAVQEYPARKAQVFRPGGRATPRSPFITYLWPDLEPSPDDREALRRRAARVGYLGCADSPVRVCVDAPVGRDGRQLWRPDDDGDTTVSVPYPGYLDILDRKFDEFTDGVTPRAVSITREKVWYRSPSTPSPNLEEPTIFWLDLSRPSGSRRSIGARRAVAVADALRRATLDLYGGPGAEAPPVLHGHGIARGTQHARFVPLPDVGHRHGSGNILGAAVWLPPATDSDVVAKVRLALSQLGELRLPGGTTFEVALRFDTDAPPKATKPGRWTDPATTFATVFPAVHERYGPMDDPLATVGRWCTNAGLPTPLAVDVLDSSHFGRVPRFTARDVWRPKSTDGYPFTHLRVRFARPQSGPVVIGRGRSYGLGLLVPIADDEMAFDTNRTDAAVGHIAAPDEEATHG